MNPNARPWPSVEKPWEYKMVSLRAYQEELKNLIFFKKEERTQSILWKEKIPERLRVYRNNTRSNWTDTLDCDFALTKKQFSPDDWQALVQRYFEKHPPRHWELNASVAPFPNFLARQKIKPCTKELADYEWHDLKVFIDRTEVRKGSGKTNPTAVVRVYQHQIFFWVEKSAPANHPPLQKPEVLVFFRDSKNTNHIMEADPLMLLVMDHFRNPTASIEDLEREKQRLLPNNAIPIETVIESLKQKELIL